MNSGAMSQHKIATAILGAAAATVIEAVRAVDAPREKQFPQKTPRHNP